MTGQRILAGTCALLTIALLGGCSQESEIMSVEEQNKAIVRHVHEEMSKGNVAVFDEVLAADYVRHCQAMPPGFQELHGTEQFIAFSADFLQAVPNCRDTIDLMIAKDDWVAYVTTMTGTQRGQLGNLPPSGKDFTVTNIIIHRFENGKIAESWVSWDNVAMLTQLGHLAPIPPDEL